jgi:hypothetical protein
MQSAEIVVFRRKWDTAVWIYRCRNSWLLYDMFFVYECVVFEQTLKRMLLHIGNVINAIWKQVFNPDHGQSLLRTINVA